MTGNTMGQVLAGSRMLFALAENGELPRLFRTIHRRYHTPSNAILVTTIVALALALSGSFTVLAVASAIARLLTYIGACAATVRLRQPSFEGMVKPAAFVIPMGTLVPVLAIGVSLLMLAGATRPQMLGGVAALVAGAALFFANDRFGRSQQNAGNMGPAQTAGRG